MSTLRYPGVRPFESNERHLFFGRARDIADLYDLVLLEKLLVLFGKSGYGKSSLLKAGIVPLFTELAADAAGQYPPVEVRLGSYVEGKSAAPLATLLSVLNERLPQQPGAEFLTPLFSQKNENSAAGVNPTPDPSPPRRKGRRDTTSRRMSGLPSHLGEGSGVGLKTTLWHECQRRKAPKGGRALLIFDQFEEFFTYPQAERDEFCAQLSEALYEATPQNVRAQLDQFSATDRQFLAVPFDLKVVFSIRSDRLSLLDSMKGRLPAIFNKRYELRALDEKQARSAIVRPASLSADDGHFGSPSFTFADAALGIIVEKLATAQAGQGGRIESFQLQIVCQHLERQVQRGRIADRDGQPDIYPEDLPNFETVFEDYYHDKLSELPPADQQAARALIEDGLLFLNEATGEARRLSKDPGELVQTFGRRGVTPALLQQLEATYLLRREANTVGGYNYEISHDTLLAPIVKAAMARRAAEEQARLEHEAAEARAAEAEALRREREAERRRKRATLLAWGAGVAAVLAIAASGLAFLKTQEAEQQTALANAKTLEAQQEKNEARRQEQLALYAQIAANESAKNAIQKTLLAQEAQRQANANLRSAKQAEATAKAALERVEQEKNATEAQRKIAEDNFLLAQEKTQEAKAQAEAARLALEKQQAALADVARLTLREADKNIYLLDYEGALEKMKSAAALGAAQPEVSDALLEIAFFFAETGRFARAQGVLDTAAQLAGAASPFRLPAERAGLDDFRSAIKTLGPARLAALDARYFPTMLPIPGGTDTLGSEVNDDEKPRHAVTLSPFKMARTETTWWQYNLFCEATGREKPSKPAGWGGEGDNPVVNVDWYDATDYANWLSEREGAEKAVSKKDGKYALSLRKGGYRLPTEAEWEYAARASSAEIARTGSSRMTKYAGSDNIDEVAWYEENSGSRTHPVAQKKPNAYGLYDLSGNVWEWCWDWYGVYPSEPKTNWTGPERGSYRVYRGGSWYVNAGGCRVSLRGTYSPGFRYYVLGFRLASSPQ